MAKTNKPYSFDASILRLRLSNWERIVNTKTVVDFRRQRITLLEQRLAALEAELRIPALRKVPGTAQLADRLRTAWKGGK